MINEFVNDIKNSPFLSRILDGHNVIMVFVYGSRLIDLVDDRSDFDLLVITDNNEKPSQPQEQLTYEGVIVQWCYKPLGSIIDSRRKPCDNFAAVELAFLTEESIVYENPTYAGVIQFLKDRKETIGRLNVFNLFNAEQKIINSILAEGAIAKPNYTKILYHLCYASYYVYGEAPNREFLIELKRICESPVREQYVNLAVTRLAMLRDFVANNTFDIDNAVAMLDSEASIFLKNM